MAGERLLLVDDEENLRSMLEAALRHHGFDVVTAANGRDALAAVPVERPDLVLLDVMLPELDGWEVLKIIRREHDVPVIMLTARSDEVDRLVGLGLGADGYVVKPFSFREVLARVRAVLRRSRPTCTSMPLTVSELLN